MDAAIHLDDLNSLIDDLETQINEVALPKPQAATITDADSFITYGGC